MITDDPNIYLQDFGKPVAINGVNGVGILDAPGELLIGDVIMSTDYTLTASSALVGNLAYGSEITVDGTAFVVKENKPNQDGLFHVLSLSKVSPETPAPGARTREWSLSDLADVDMRNPQRGDRLVYDGAKWIDMEEIDGTNIVNGGDAQP